MKKLILLKIVFLGSINIANAQLFIDAELAFGNSGGKASGIYSPTINDTQYDSIAGSKSKSYFHIGALINYSPSKNSSNFYFTTGVIANTKSITYVKQRIFSTITPRIRTSTSEVTDQYMFLCIPLRLNYEIVQKNNQAIILAAGVRFNFQTGTFGLTGNETVLDAIVGYRYKKLRAKLLFSPSLNNISTNSEIRTVKFNSYALTLGYELFRNKK